MIRAGFGVFLQPIAGIMSDRCRSSLGRRRPFLLTFTFTVCAGFMLVMFGQALAQAIVPVHTPLALIAVIMFAGYGYAGRVALSPRSVRRGVLTVAVCVLGLAALST